MSSIVSRCVSFGNPSLGTYNGKVYTTTSEKASTENNNACNNIVAMVDVPAEEVPEGILTFARGHRPNIKHVRVLVTTTTTSTRSSSGGNKEELLEDKSNNSRKYIVLFELFSSENASLFVSDLHNKPFTSLQDDIKCHVYHVVALEGDAGVSLMSPFFASTSNNTSSVDTSQNCPVCLEVIETNTSILTTLCNHTFHIDCLLQWQDSPCPVCRYDHSGLNETLSQCHKCGTTENNYVCLICGVISCSNRHNASIGGGIHARQHYLSTLHAYALEIDTQYVYDFVGDGFVHRIIQNKEDGKLVEFSDPNTTSNERTLNPGLSDAQEGQVVHRKLEQYASQYYTLLKSQLEQQRIYYEAKLQEIKRQHDYQKSNSNNAQVNTANFIAALKQDKHTLSQRCITLQKKSSKLKNDVDFLKNMNESLQDNKICMDRQIREVKEDIEKYDTFTSTLLSPLEEKLQKLMVKLEESMIDNDDDRKIPAR